MRTRKASEISKYLSFAMVFSVTSCGPTAEDRSTVALEPEASIQAELARLSGESGLAVVDLSVTRDRFAQAPAALEQLAGNLSQRVPGIYVMRYSDDTLRTRVHIFDTRIERILYVTLTWSTSVTSIAGGQLTLEEAEISDVEFDPATSTLTLTGATGTVHLSPQDVTPVGA